MRCSRHSKVALQNFLTMCDDAPHLAVKLKCVYLIHSSMLCNVLILHSPYNGAGKMSRVCTLVKHALLNHALQECMYSKAHSQSL